MAPIIPFVDTSIDKKIDLHAYLVTHPAATFFARVASSSMVEAGILPGDLLIVDRSLQPQNGKFAVGYDGEEFLVKKLPFEFETSCITWGVVSGVVRRL